MSAVYPSQLDGDKHVATFPGKTCLNRRKNHGCGQEKTEGSSSLYLVSGPLPNAANSNEVPTEFAGKSYVGPKLKNEGCVPWG